MFCLVISYCKTAEIPAYTNDDKVLSHHRIHTWTKNDHTQPLRPVWDFLDGARSPGL